AATLHSLLSPSGLPQLSLPSPPRRRSPPLPSPLPLPSQTPSTSMRFKDEYVEVTLDVRDGGGAVLLEGFLDLKGVELLL
ncbi:unnamed protein product, partial [Urochloa humidicola]